MQETRWAGEKSRDIGRGFKCIYFGKSRTTNGVGIIIADRFRNATAEVQRYDDRLMKIILVYERRRLHFFSAYAPHTGCAEAVKEAFWALLDEKTAEVPQEDTIIVAGDLNGHVGSTKDAYRCHGGQGFGITKRRRRADPRIRRRA